MVGGLFRRAANAFAFFNTRRQPHTASSWVRESLEYVHVYVLGVSFEGVRGPQLLC
jgi:hypothetical protein